MFLLRSVEHSWPSAAIVSRRMMPAAKMNSIPRTKIMPAQSTHNRLKSATTNLIRAAQNFVSRSQEFRAAEKRGIGGELRLAIIAAEAAMQPKRGRPANEKTS